MNFREPQDQPLLRILVRVTLASITLITTGFLAHVIYTLILVGWRIAGVL